MAEISDLWQEYKQTGSQEIKDQLIENYIPLVRQIASGIIKKLRSDVEFDDLVSDGLFGLMRAVDNFDLSRGYKFETYATPVIRGSIYNGLRTLDWIPERTRGKARAIQKEREQYYVTTGRFPTEEELAEELKMSSEEVYNMIVNLGCIYLLSLDQPIASMDDDSTTIKSTVNEDPVSNPQVKLEFSEERDHLRRALENLNERERYIITKHYFEGITFESISHDLDVSKQRVSQMHARAVEKMREYLGQMTISEEAIKDFTTDECNLIPPVWKFKNGFAG